MSSAMTPRSRMEGLLAGQVQARGRSLYRVAYNILRDASLAEDVCQQAFMKAWEQQDRLRAHEALGAWLTQTVVNESLSVHRRRRTETRAFERQRKEEAVWDHEAAGNEEQREKVLFEVGRLSEPIRVVVILRLLEGIPGNQVAELLECSAVEVSRRLHQGMEILRGQLNERQAGVRTTRT